MAMKYSELGRTGISVSRTCLGTMTFGEQNTAAEAFRQLDRAVDRGVNFIDAAEMYPIPPRAETAGRTEEILGDWMRSRNARNRVVLATKVSGPGLAHIRGGEPSFHPPRIEQAIDGSLKRLKTDRVDLYQLHWPERKTNMFGKRGYAHDDSSGRRYAPARRSSRSLRRWSRPARCAPSGFRTRPRGGSCASCNWRRNTICPGSRASRTRTVFSIACSRSVSRRWPFARTADCWRTRRWRSAR